MQIDRILYPITSLGPGKRLCIWTVGCKKRCPMCANPELHNFDEGKDIALEEIQKIITTSDFSDIDGFTVSGGEPFCQPKELLKILTKKSEDILVFSGYTFEELIGMKDFYVRSCLDYIGVLVAGEYIDELNDNATALVASVNQKLHIFHQSLQGKYEIYLREGRQIQNIFYNNEMMSVGIHNREDK